jgi:phage terminase Nu1 subunit (DNA packaging protein)
MVTQQAIAAHLDLSTRRVRELIHAGVISRNADLDAARLSYLRYLREQTAGRRGDPGAPDLVTERAALARVQRERIEIEIARTKGQLVPAAECERTFAEMLKIVVAMLETLPDVLERDAGIGPRAVQRCIEVIDQLREGLYQRLIAPDGTAESA